MKKISISLVVVLVFAFCIIGYRQRYIAVNERVPNVPLTVYHKGEMVAMEKDILMESSMEGYEIQINDAEVLTYEKFLKKYNAEDEYTQIPDKVYDVSVTLKNVDADDGIGIDLSEFYLQGNCYFTGLNTNLLEVSSPNLDGAVAIALRKGTEFNINLPFDLYEDDFRNSTWNNLEKFDMNFVATLYPKKKVIAINK